MAAEAQKLSVTEKVGYSLGDAAANFVFMTMILFQANFYTDVMGLAAGTAADHFAGGPLVGCLLRSGDGCLGRPHAIAVGPISAVDFVHGAALGHRDVPGVHDAGRLEHVNSIVVYALVTNVLLMTLYSANNMPYSALGGVMTGDVYERTSLNAYRFVAANLAQLIVAGFTLPLVAKFAASYGEGDTARATGWQITMGMWAVVCVVFFLITFATTRERVEATVEHKSSLKQDFADLLANRPWLVMFVMTLDPLHDSLVARRSILQLLPLLRRQDRHVRLARRSCI